MFLSEQMVVKIGDFGLASAFKGKSFGLYNMDTMVNITITSSPIKGLSLL